MNPDKINPKNFIKIDRTRTLLGLRFGIPSPKYNGGQGEQAWMR